MGKSVVGDDSHGENMRISINSKILLCLMKIELQRGTLITDSVVHVLPLHYMNAADVYTIVQGLEEGHIDKVCPTRMELLWIKVTHLNAPSYITNVIPCDILVMLPAISDLFEFGVQRLQLCCHHFPGRPPTNFVPVSKRCNFPGPPTYHSFRH